MTILSVKAKFVKKLAFIHILGIATPIGGKILVPLVKTEILVYDNGGYSAIFLPLSLLDFNSKNWRPRQDIEARGLKFCMEPCMTKTHTV